MEKQPFDGYKPNLFPRLERAGAFLSGVWNAGKHVELCLSEHNRGASVMLDEALDEQLTLPFEEGGRWDSEGNYYTAPYIDRSRV